MTQNVRVVLVDDHATLRHAVAERLNREPDINVVASVSSADAAIDAALAHKPDLIIMDVNMPGLVCFEAVRRLETLLPGLKVLFLSGFHNDRYIEEALEVGARGYLSKAEPIDRVIQAIREVAAGGLSFSKEVMDRIVVCGTGGPRLRAQATRASVLTTREKEVLQYIARGMPKKAIAATMGLSVRTVERHTENLMAKLDIHDRVDLARYAIREGYAQP